MSDVTENAAPYKPPLNVNPIATQMEDVVGSESCSFMYTNGYSAGCSLASAAGIHIKNGLDSWVK